jgi:hypothetical protein
MTDKRMTNPADMVKHLTDLILDERRKLEEALANISEYSEQLRRVASDTERRLLTRD